MSLLIFFIELSFITIILFISLYFDLKFREIPNKFLKIFFLFSLVLNICEFLFLLTDLLLSLIVKIIIFLIVFLISLLLFSLKIIGGSDGKLILLIFSIHPVKYLNYYNVLLFFLFYSLFFLIFFFFNLIINCTDKNSYLFQIYFDFHGRGRINSLFIKMFYKFVSLSKLKDKSSDKFFIETLFIIYNNKKRRIQILLQYRPPLMIICLTSYYLIFFLIIVI